MTTGKAKGCLWILVIGVILVIAGNQAEKSVKRERLAKMTPEQIAAEKTKDSIADQLSGATYVCRKAAEASLKAPSTAVFQDGSYRKDLGNGRSKIRLQVDAQNSFGAMIRTTVECRVQLKNDQYTLTSVKSW